MNFGLNLLWFVFFFGWAAALMWATLGGIMFLTVIGIPFGFGALRIAGFSAWPFGREAIKAELIGEQRTGGTGLANFLWITMAGIWLAIVHVSVGLSACLTLIGIPIGIQHFKIAGLCFAPLGRRIVPKELAKEAVSRATKAKLDAALQH